MYPQQQQVATKSVKRRELLTGLLGLAAGGALPIPFIQAATTGSDSPNDGQPFSREWLRETARQRGQEPYLPPTDARPPWLAAMDYDDYQDLNKFHIDRSLWAGGNLPFQARFFTIGLFFHYAVDLYEVVNGIAQSMSLSPDMLDYGPRRAKDKIRWCPSVYVMSFNNYAT